MRRKRRRMGGEGQPQEWGRVYKGKASWELQTVNSSNEMCKKSGLRLLLAFMFSWVASWQKGKRNLAGGVVLCGGWRASGGSGLERDLSLSSGEHHHHHQTIFTFWRGFCWFFSSLCWELFMMSEPAWCPHIVTIDIQQLQAEIKGIHAKNVWCCGDGYFGQKN